MPRYTEVIEYKDKNNFFDKCPDAYWKRIAQGLYYTGCRAGELVKISREDIIVEDNIIKIRIHTEKNPHAPIRYVPINPSIEPDAIKVFEPNLGLSGLLFPCYNPSISQNSFLRVMRKKFNEFWGVAPHYFRHARLTHCVTQFDFNDQELVKYAGWTDSKPAKWYVSLKTSDLVKKMVVKGE